MEGCANGSGSSWKRHYDSGGASSDTAESREPEGSGQTVRNQSEDCRQVEAPHLRPPPPGQRRRNPRCSQDRHCFPPTHTLLHLDVRREAEPRTVEDAGRIDAIAAQARKVLVFPWRDARWKPPSAQSPAPDRRHVGFRPGLVEEDEALGVEPSFDIFSVRKRAISGRSCSLGSTFLPVGADEGPDRPVIDLDAAFGKFSLKAKGKAPRRPCAKEAAVRQQQPRSVAVHRASGRAARRPKALRPQRSPRSPAKRPRPIERSRPPQHAQRPAPANPMNKVSPSLPASIRPTA
jgi:hypothetical protein